MTRSNKKETVMAASNSLKKFLSTSRAKARTAHASHLADIQALLGALSAAVAKIDSSDTDIHWGHVGDAADIREKLALALRVATGSDFDHADTDVVVAEMARQARRR
jgi:hypothetical protein